MSIAVSIRIGINLGAGNAEQPRVSARVTIGCGSKYLHCEKKTHLKNINFILPDTLLAFGKITLLM